MTVSPTIVTGRVLELLGGADPGPAPQSVLLAGADDPRVLDDLVAAGHAVTAIDAGAAVSLRSPDLYDCVVAGEGVTDLPRIDREQALLRLAAAVRLTGLLVVADTDALADAVADAHGLVRRGLPGPPASGTPAIAIFERVR